MTSSPEHSGPTDHGEPARRSPGRWRGEDIRRAVGILFLVLQGIFIGYARLQPEPVVHLSAVGGHTSYRIFVTIDGESLDPGQIASRYKIPHRGRTTLTPAGLHEIVQEYEGGRGQGDFARVRLHTRYNNEPEDIWLWPQL